jgi:hypothetical protein
MWGGEGGTVYVHTDRLPSPTHTAAFPLPHVYRLPLPHACLLPHPHAGVSPLRMPAYMRICVCVWGGGGEYYI